VAEIIPGINRFILPTPFSAPTYVNIYLIQEDNGYLLIDTGWNNKESFDSLKQHMAEAGADFEDIRRIIITHTHPDHYGLVYRLKQLCQAELITSNEEKDAIEARYINLEDYVSKLERMLNDNGTPPDELPEFVSATSAVMKVVTPVLPDRILQEGETIHAGNFNLHVFQTPGHSPGHLCLYEPTQKFLFSGDHVLPNISPNIGLHLTAVENPLGDYLDSLKLLRQLEVSLALPGHEEPFTNLTERIDELIRHHETRNSEILELLKTRPKTGYQIATEIQWLPNAAESSWQRLDAINRRLAIPETLAHLEAMRNDGKVVKLSRDSIIYYQQT